MVSARGHASKKRVMFIPDEGHSEAEEVATEESEDELD